MKSAINISTVVTYAVLLLLTILALYTINALNISYPLSVTNHAASGELSVVGEGKVEVVPDTATVEIGIVVNDAVTVEEARSQLNEANNSVVAAVTKLGIGKKDVKTSNYSVNPNYSYPEGGKSTISGYNGNVNLSVKITEVEKLPEVIQVATDAGANNIYGTNYTVDEPEKYREEAREKAITNAREQAQKLASSLGIRLGRVVNVVESSPGMPPMLYDKMAMSVEGRGGDATANLQPGSQTITSTVTLYFEKR